MQEEYHAASVVASATDGRSPALRYATVCHIDGTEWGVVFFGFAQERKGAGGDLWANLQLPVDRHNREYCDTLSCCVCLIAYAIDLGQCDTLSQYRELQTLGPHNSGLQAPRTTGNCNGV